MEEIKCITILRSGYLLKKVRSSPEKKGDQSTFFLQYGQNYNPEKKYAVPLRTIIGKAHPSDNTLMYPNEKYQEYFPDAVLPEELPEAYRSCCLRIGAYAIIRYVLNELKETMLRLETRSNFMTVPATLRELEKIEMVRRSNGQYRLDHAVSKKQKTILSAFGLSDRDIRVIATEISNLLVTNQSLRNMIDAKEEESYGEDTFDNFD